MSTLAPDHEIDPCRLPHRRRPATRLAARATSDPRSRHGNAAPPAASIVWADRAAEPPPRARPPRIDMRTRGEQMREPIPVPGRKAELRSDSAPVQVQPTGAGPVPQAAIGLAQTFSSWPPKGGATAPNGSSPAAAARLCDGRGLSLALVIAAGRRGFRDRGGHTRRRSCEAFPSLRLQPLADRLRSLAGRRHETETPS